MAFQDFVEACPSYLDVGGELLRLAVQLEESDRRRDSG